MTNFTLKRKYILFFIFISVSVSAQVEMGKWRMHRAYNNATQLAQTPNKIFVVSDQSLYSVGKEDYDIELYTKVGGLSDTEVSQIKYDESTKQLIIIYTNGNIDLMGSGGIVNVPDLYNKQMTSSKTVNSISIHNSKAYLSTNFGIIVLDLNRREVSDTYYIGTNATDVVVLATAIYNGRIYAVGQSSIYSASLTSNLIDYHSWSIINSSVLGSGNFQSLAAHSSYMFMLRGGVLYRLEGADWSRVSIVDDIFSLHVESNYLYVRWGYQILRYDSGMNPVVVPYAGSDMRFDSENGVYWLAAGEKGVGAYRVNEGVNAMSFYKPDGPENNSAWDFTMVDGKLFVVPGGRWAAQNNTPGSVSIFENESWTKIQHSQISSVSNSLVLDFMNVAVDPSDNSHFYVTSFGTGLYEFRDNTFFQRYINSNTNGIIQPYPNLDPNEYTRLDGAVFDGNGNLYFSNSGVVASVKLRMNDGTWHQLQYPNGSQSEALGKIHVNTQNNNQKWRMSVRITGGVLVWDDNGTILDVSDDKSKFFTSFNYVKGGSIVSANPAYFTCIAQDQAGVIWVGTDQGPLLFNNTDNIFNTDYTCTKVLIPRNDGTGYGDYLLDNVTVQAIAVDGSNRKWIATQTSGVYLVSSSGLETIHHFTAENSPLPSNDVKTIAINPRSGEVFFGTSTGIASFQSDAASAETYFNDVKAYPNPVREGYEGMITITGLVENSIVKITDAMGNLVCQTISNGSIATWDGRDARGKKVNTGVYVVLAAKDDGTLGTATKILVFK